MTIIFLTNNYLPTPFANGVCIHALAKESVKRGYETHVVCYGDLKSTYTLSIDGVIVHKIRVPLYYGFLRFYENHKRWLAGRLAYKTGRMCSLYHKFIHQNEYPLQDGGITRRMVKECGRVIGNSEDKDVRVVASYTPVEGIKAGSILKAKYPEVQCIYYSLDTLSNEAGVGVLSAERRRVKGIEQEVRYFSIYDKVILMNCHRKHYTSDSFKPFTDKITFADFPLFAPQGIEKTESRKSIVYAGSLYRVVRNPRPALELLDPILENYTLHFYGHSDCDDIIEEYAKKHPGHIINHGLVPHEQVIEASRNADILLSIGNAKTQMAPSKIFEQMSTGKPIIHTFAEDSDICVPLLRKYSNALCVDMNNVASADIRGFVDGMIYLDEEALNGMFKEAMPAYTVDIIEGKSK